MSSMERALQELCSLEREASGDGWMQRMHPLVKLWLTVWYVGLLLSLPNEKTAQILSMALYPFAVFLAADSSFVKCVRRIRLLAGGVLLLGLANCLFAGNLYRGVIEMAGLCGKGLLAVTGVYLLAVTTRVEDICESLRRLHLPEILVTVILFIYRYISVLLKETKRLWEAYQVLAPGHRGLHPRTWGAFVGQLLLRSMERAHRVYDSMCVRGYEEQLTGGSRRYPLGGSTLVWLAGWTAGLFILRNIPLFQLVGAVFWR